MHRFVFFEPRGEKNLDRLLGKFENRFPSLFEQAEKFRATRNEGFTGWVLYPIPSLPPIQNGINRDDEVRREVESYR